MTPTIGRTVHYVSRGSADGQFSPTRRAAIITEVRDDIEDGVVSLAVLNPTGLFFDQHVSFAEEPTPGCWSWPPRV